MRGLICNICKQLFWSRRKTVFCSEKCADKWADDFHAKKREVKS